MASEMQYGSEAIFAYNADNVLDVYVIEITPYVFAVNKKIGKTTIYLTKPSSLESVLMVSKEKILETNAIIELPWHDKDKVMEYVRMYILFS